MGCGNVLENAKLNDRSKCSAAPEIVMWVRLKKALQCCCTISYISRQSGM